jgi:colicin import membrane protein
MPGFLREYSWPITVSVLLHAGLAAALLFVTLMTITRSPPSAQQLPVDAVVIDSQVLHAAQRELQERADAQAAIVRAANEAHAAEQAAAQQSALDEQHAAEQAKLAQATAAKQALEDAQRVAETQKAEAARQADERKRAEDAKAAEEAKHVEDAKRAADAKQVDDAKRAAEQKAKAEREAELRRQLADEEHRSAVEASPARDQYIARLASRIQNAWLRPPSARAGLDCVVNIIQVPGGEVTSAHVSQCNGDAAARQSIENAVYRASPLPAPSDPALFERNLVIHFHPEE